MNYSIGEIRKAILKLEDNNVQGFFIEIPKGGEIVFHRDGNKIIIRNHKNIDYGMMYFDRGNLNRGSSEEEKDYLFSIFLENIRKNHLNKLGI